MAINILDKQLSNLIAAGEVVERPASAIKEMLENSADATAHRITVEIKNGGVSYFRVTDDGIGMSREDLPKSIMRHATSKISTSSDLYAICTYGFRGEALAAIAAVCDLRILTKRSNDAFGSVLHVNGGEVLECGDAGCPDGTTIAASNIFMNVPARRKFLKKDSTEASACLAVTEKFALSRPDIAVTFISDGTVKLKTAGDGILKNTIYSCLGKDFASKLIALDYVYEGVKISGFIGKPETARPGRSMQNFFVNGRFVRSGTICAALEEGFRAFCPSGKFPAAVIFCDLDFSRVDVNIHPAKTEVKFSEEKKVFEAVLFAVRTALNSGTSFSNYPDTAEQGEFISQTVKNKNFTEKKLYEQKSENKNSVFSSPSLSPDKIAEKIGIDPESLCRSYSENIKLSGNTDYNKNKLDPPDFKNAFSEYITNKDSSFYNNTDKKGQNLFVRSPIPASMDIFAPQQTPIYSEEPKKTEEKQISLELPSDTSVKSEFRVIGECFDSFILVEKDSSLYIIDKHAAHERILYEEIKHSAKNISSQILLEPVRIMLSTEEYAAVSENAEYFKGTGFDIDLFGARTIIVRSFPEHIDSRDLQDIFHSIAEKLAQGNGHAAGDIFDKALFTAACKAAVKAGQRNSLFQDEYIAEKIFSSEAILYCPHGRPVIIEFSKEKLYRDFKRT